ncbi:MAG: VOC family protein [Pirellulaceae bacterium]
MALKIGLTSIFVDDQAKAQAFYTEVLGFRTKMDLPMGEARWLTVVSADAPDGTQLLLEPNINPTAADFQKAVFEQGIPAASFESEDVHKEHERLTAAGVEFTMPPTALGDTTLAMFKDTCGNVVQIYQE